MDPEDVQVPEPIQVDKPKLSIGPSGLLNMRAPDGTPVAANPEHADSLLSDGYTLASDEEVQAQATADAEREEYTDFGSTVATAAEGLAQGATMGLYGLGAQALAGPEYTRERELRERYNPGVAMASTIAGAVAPAIASGGATAAASVPVRAAASVARMTPAGAVARLGNAIVSSIGAGGGVARTFAGGAIGAAVEGSIDTATRTVAQDMLDGKVDITAERLALSLIGSAAISGLIGGALNIRMAPKAADAVSSAPGLVDDAIPVSVVDDIDEAVASADQVSAIDDEIDSARTKLYEVSATGDNAGYEAAVAALDEAIERREAAVRSQVAAPEKDVIASIDVSLPDEVKSLWESIKSSVSAAKNKRDLDRQFSDRLDSMAKSFTAEMDEFQRLDQNILEPALNRSKKPKATAAVLARNGLEWTPEKAAALNGSFAEIRDGLKAYRAEMAQSPAGAGGPQGSILLKAEQAIDRVSEKLTGLRGSGPIAPSARIMAASDLEKIGEIFREYDDLRTYLGKLAVPKGTRGTNAEFYLQGIYAKIRALQLHRGIWGDDLARMQGETNVAIKNNIDSGGRFDAIFGLAKSELGESAGEADWFKLREFDPRKVQSFLSQVGDGANHKHEEAFALGLKRRIEHAETLMQYYPIGGAQVKALSQQRDIATRLLGEVRQMKALKALRARAGDELERTADMQKVVSAVESAVLMVPVAGPALVGALRGSRTVAGAAVEAAREAAKKEAVVEKSAKSVISSIVANATAKARSYGRMGPVGGLGVSSSAIMAAYKESQEILDESSSRRIAFERSVAEIADDSPELAAMIRDKAIARASAIVGTIPNQDGSDPLYEGATKKRTAVEEEKLARYIAAARDPYGAIKRLGSGSGSDEDIAALRALHPAMYRSFGERVIANARKERNKLTVPQRQQLHRITGMPTLPEHDPARFAAVQSLAASQSEPKEQPKPGRRGPVKPVDPDALMSRSDALMTADD